MAHHAQTPAMAGISGPYFGLQCLAALLLLMSIARHAGAEIVEEVHGPMMEVAGAGLQAHAGFSREQDQGLKRTAAVELVTIHADDWASLVSVSLEGWSEDSMRISSWGWAHRMEFASLQDARAALGFNAEMENTPYEDRPWKFSAGPVMHGHAGRLEWRLNLLFEKSWAAQDAVSSWRSRLKLRYESGDSIEAGLLGFASLHRRSGKPDDHQPNAIGPAWFGRFGTAAAPVQIETGLLFLLRGHRTNGALWWLQAEIPF